jgi:hypothetical protein
MVMIPLAERDQVPRRHAPPVTGVSPFRNPVRRLATAAVWCLCATAASVAWWNGERLHSACGDVPPADFKAACRQRLPATTEAA